MSQHTAPAPFATDLAPFFPGQYGRNTERNARIIAMRRAGARQWDIADEFGITAASVSRLLALYAPDLHATGKKARSAERQAKVRRVIELRRDGLVYKQIAQAVCLTPSRVAQIVRAEAPELTGDKRREAAA